MAKKKKMSAHLATFNGHVNDATNRATKAFKMLFGEATFQKEIKPYIKKGIMSIFDVKSNEYTKWFVETIAIFVNEEAPASDVEADSIIDPESIECDFSLYQGRHQSITLQSVITLNSKQDRLFARVEYSGSESCYVEVARENCRSGRWERFAFAKMGNVSFGDDLTDKQKATAIVRLINTKRDADYRIVNMMPDWESR